MPVHARDTHVGLVGYDISNHKSFKEAMFWVHEVREYGRKDIVMVLIACKSDLEDKRAVPLAEAEAFATEYGCLHVQTSVKSRLNLDKPFIDGATRWFEQH